MPVRVTVTVVTAPDGAPPGAVVVVDARAERDREDPLSAPATASSGR